MKLGSHIKIVIQVLDIFFESRAPFDIILAKFFRNSRTGAHDRREIADFSYSIFRNFEKLKFLTKNITANFARFYVLAHLKTQLAMSREKIAEIFSGERYCPEKLSNFEMKFLDSVDKKNNFPENALLNYPEWMTPLLQKSFDSHEMINEMSALNEKAFVDLRVNTLKASRDEVKKMLEAFQPEDCHYAVNGLRLLNGRISRNHDVIAKGFAEIQDEGSQLVAEVCAVAPDNTVVDFCAGAGG
ncbi:MAG: hypothetical protein LBJ71_04525, partial [Holosporaceae bacterium]|nr:hypothetical protein [Holosporaceae bacterium]